MPNLNFIKYKILKPFKSWKNKYLKSITKKDANRQSLYDKTAQEISEYTHESTADVKQKHKQGPESENNYHIFENQNSIIQKDVEEFYKNCSYYLYELPLWNAERNRPKYLSLICLPYLRRNRYHKVMDLGAGAGDLCIELANNGLGVTYCDIAENLFNFAKWRFQKRGLSVKMAKGIGAVNEDFDCIFSFDAFEHIKGLPEMLEKIIKHLKPGGSLIFSGAFSGGTLHLEENEKYNEFRNLDALMRSYGLIFQDRFAQYYFYKKPGGNRI